ncbi:MAG: SAM-dependent methyltransferase, partial [Burkholderiaceae bacterium]
MNKPPKPGITRPASATPTVSAAVAAELRPGQSIALLQELHILTRDAKLNQDSRRKLKQVYHLYQFIEKILLELAADPLAGLTQDGPAALTVADHGAGKSYLGFILYDLFFRSRRDGWVYGIETRPELVEKSKELARTLGFERMS